MLLKEQKSIEISINNIMANMERGVVSRATSKRLYELEERQTELEKQVLLERNKATVKLTEEQIRNYFESGLKMGPKMLLNYFVKRINLYDDKMQIIYKNPLPLSPDQSNGQGVFFYRKDVSLRLYLYVNADPYLQAFDIDMII